MASAVIAQLSASRSIFIPQTSIRCRGVMGFSSPVMEMRLADRHRQVDVFESLCRPLRAGRGMRGKAQHLGMPFPVADRLVKKLVAFVPLGCHPFQHDFVEV